MKIKLYEQFNELIDPYGEEDWDADNLPPLIQLLRKENLYHLDRIVSLDITYPVLYGFSLFKNLEGIEKLINLKMLVCQRNELTNLEDIKDLINIKQLDCSSNQLTSLKDIHNLINIEQLDCSHNQLTSLKGIGKLFKLTHLYCYNNQLTNLNEIENLTNLEYISCRENRFSNKYKEYIKNYCKIKKINIQL